MAPKRKRANGESGPSVPSSSRGGGMAKPTNKSKVTTLANDTPRENVKKKGTPGKGTKAKKEIEASLQSTDSEENPEPSSKRGMASKKATANRDSIEKSPKVLNTPFKKKAIFSPYAKTRMEQLFATYKDVDDPTTIGGEGFEKLCTDACIPMEGAQPLILAWLLEASELGKLTKEEWTKGLHQLQIDTLEKLNIALTDYEALLILATPTKNPPSNKKPAAVPYNRNTNHWEDATDVSSTFRKFYTFVFNLSKAPQERNIDIEMAKAFWSTLLAPKYNMVNDFVVFIDNKKNVRGVNRDLWAMTLEFFECVGPSLENYEVEGAWPSLLDEFVAWKRGDPMQNSIHSVDAE